jgi:hypothetical protein
MKIALCTLMLAACWVLMGCSSASELAPATPSTRNYALPELPPRPAFDPNTRPQASAGSGQSYSFSADELQLHASGSVTSAPGVRRAADNAATSLVKTVGSLASGGGGSGRFQPLSATVSSLPAGEAAKAEEKIEREAQLAIEVKNVSEAAAHVLQLVRAHEGSVTKDQRSSGAQSTAEILVRVPSAQFDAFVSDLGGVGEIRNRNIKAVDTSIEHKDLGILVDNLEAALVRYRDLLQKATDPIQVLAVERELERVRSDLDRIKGRLEFLKDRVARSTVAIALHSAEAPHDVQPGAHRPDIAVGLRGLSLVDVRQGGTNGYVGTGLSLRLPRGAGDNGRGLVLDVDVMKACCKAQPERSDWAYDILTGIDLYSQALQSGRRRFFNPYLGLRVGFAQTQNRGDFAAAGVFGLELFKTSSLMIDIQARAVALVGNPDGPHAAVQPSIGFDLGF